MNHYKGKYGCSNTPYKVRVKATGNARARLWLGLRVSILGLGLSAGVRELAIAPHGLFPINKC